VRDGNFEAIKAAWAAIIKKVGLSTSKLLSLKCSGIQREQQAAVVAAVDRSAVSQGPAGLSVLSIQCVGKRWRLKITPRVAAGVVVADVDKKVASLDGHWQCGNNSVVISTEGSATSRVYAVTLYCNLL
jgi:hypothetical protein